jgi:GT2 family glycosyltransferase
MSEMTASILIPTRARPRYLDATLASVAPQAHAAGAELLVVDDSASDPDTAAVAARRGANVIATGGSRGANAARNAGVAASDGELVVLLDDDIRAPDGWLTELLRGAAGSPDHDVFGGPIRACLEGGGPHSCGREGAPITTLDLGEQDRDAPLVWSANMAIRRGALSRIGPFEESIRGRGEEVEWQLRYTRSGGRIRYLAAAGVEHRRYGSDARLRSLSRAGYALGRSARRYDARKGTSPTFAAETRTLIGCAAHVIRYRCPNMIAVGAHSAGRVREALAEVVLR